MIKQWYQQHKKKIRYLCVGGGNTVLGFTTFPLLIWLLEPYHLHYLVILVFANIICITNAYLGNKFLVFKTKGNYLTEVIKFFTFYGIFFAINLALLPFMVNVFNLTPIIAQTIINVAVFVSSYLWHSRISFAAPNHH